MEKKFRLGDLVEYIGDDDTIGVPKGTLGEITQVNKYSGYWVKFEDIDAEKLVSESSISRVPN